LQLFFLYFYSNKIQRTFEIRIWVEISQEFELINILKKIRGKIREINENEQGKDEEYFLMDLFQSLKEKKYLLIIDDVWTTNLWKTIQKALPNEKNGSKILMTTRNYEVAKEADPTREPYKQSFLTEKLSLELFLKNAISNQETRNECPEDLLILARKFVKKCGGLPLALVVLGGLLAKKEFTYIVWHKVMKTMTWHDNEQKDCIEIISTSYDDLPLALKSCFMYFAVFPEDYTINDIPSLLRMWISEGFIPHEENRTLEDTAESFLEDLVQRYHFV
jgi:NB-ARC domain